MDADARPATAPTTMTLAELAAFLAVSPQALYDLRSKGRGPRGFRVGRHLRFRAAEIEAWIRAMEEADGRRHGAGGPP
ncbi:AlpA family transcriptional regulator [Actinotalea sp. Marseille-Q4924]|uniref:helix-turn-helix transcriptional regulator n=1 Tax=Actinotalea sp. Marseille-Q4924 TaxID=2866571 RepID=UPI001CE3ED4D|nr:helix-turn-helix domain-containing protein [Actinotalea sp. Marseille-Q4924]